VGVAGREAVRLAIPLSTTKFARSFEAEADYLVVEYLYKTGYDPQALISFFERVQRKKGKTRIRSQGLLHTSTNLDRIRKTQREIDGILPARETYVLSTSEFADVKSCLTILHNMRAREQGANRPILQRTPAEEGDSSRDDDQRPTLSDANNSITND